MKWAGTIGNGEDKDGAGLVGGGTTDAEEVEKRGDTIGDGGGGDAVGDVEDDDGVRDRANGPCGTGGGLLFPYPECAGLSLANEQLLAHTSHVDRLLLHYDP
nr:hypothetical protein Iba_chr04eCG17570 [Ipomoea batatas]